MTEGASFILVLTAAAGIAWWGMPADRDAITKLVCNPGPNPWNEPDCHVPITPKTMTLRFVTEDEFKSASAGNSWGAFSEGSGTGLCTILIPAKGSIEAYQETGGARWEGNATDLSRILPHEILHCLAGKWHADPYPLSYIYGLKWRNSEPGRADELEELAYQPPFMERYGIR